MKKRFFALFLALLMLCAACAFGEGEETVHSADQPFEEIPEGLEPMYELMLGAPAAKATVANVCRMPNGRVLVSVAATNVGGDFPAEVLLAQAPKISARLDRALGGKLLWHDGGIASAEITERFGASVMSMTVKMAAGGSESSLFLTAEGLLFTVQGVLMEIWTVSPTQPAYPFNEAAAAELEADLASARDFVEKRLGMDSFMNGSFNLFTGEPNLAPSTANPDALPPESVSYTDPDGFFTLNIPVGAVILTPTSSEEEFEAAKAGFVAAHPEGSERAFELFREDALEEDGVLIFTPDYRGQIQLYREQKDIWKDFTLGVLAQEAELIRANLAQEYGGCEILTSFEKETLSGMDHVREVYRVSCGDMSMLLSVLGIAIPEDILREVDIFADSQELFDSLYRLAVDSVVYHEPAADPAAE